ncbi:MAG: GAF domain-containing protein [Pseudomonadota bacterium]
MNDKEKDFYRALYEVAKVINSSLEPEILFKKIAESVTSAMKVKGVSIRLLDSPGKRLLLAASHGLSKGYLRKGPVEVGKSGIDQEALAGRVVAIQDVRTDPRFQYHEQAKDEGIISVLVVPLRVDDRTIGVLRVYTPEYRDFAPDEMDFVTAIANLSAIAIENAHLHQALKRDYELLADFEYRLFND